MQRKREEEDRRRAEEERRLKDSERLRLEQLKVRTLDLVQVISVCNVRQFLRVSGKVDALVLGGITLNC